MVHVVSMDDVPIRFGSISFQSNEVRGAQKSEFLFYSELELKLNIFHYFFFFSTKLTLFRSVSSRVSVSVAHLHTLR